MCMYMIDDHELNRIIEITNLDEFELPVIGFQQERLDDLSHESTGFGLATTMDMDSTSGLALGNRST